MKNLRYLVLHTRAFLQYSGIVFPCVAVLFGDWNSAYGRGADPLP